MDETYQAVLLEDRKWSHFYWARSSVSYCLTIIVFFYYLDSWFKRLSPGGQGEIISVNSYGPSSGPDYMGGPKLHSNSASCLFENAKTVRESETSGNGIIVTYTGDCATSTYVSGDDFQDGNWEQWRGAHAAQGLTHDKLDQMVCCTLGLVFAQHLPFGTTWCITTILWPMWKPSHEQHPMVLRKNVIQPVCHDWNFKRCIMNCC